MSPNLSSSDPLEAFPDVVAALALAVPRIAPPARLKERLDARLGEFARERQASFNLLSRPADRLRDPPSHRAGVPAPREGKTPSPASSSLPAAGRRPSSAGTSRRSSVSPSSSSVPTAPSCPAHGSTPTAPATASSPSSRFRPGHPSRRSRSGAPRRARRSSPQSSEPACPGAAPHGPARRAPPVVPARAPRPSLPEDERPVGHLGLGGDPPADDRRRRRPALGELPLPLPDRLLSRGRRGAGRPGGMERPRLLRPRAQSPSRGPPRGGKGWLHPALGGGAAHSPGHRPLHRRRHRLHRVRPSGRGPGRKRRPRPRAPPRHSRRPPDGSLARLRRGRRGGIPEPAIARRPQPGIDGARGAGLSSALPSLRGVPARPGLPRPGLGTSRGLPREPPAKAHRLRAARRRPRAAPRARRSRPGRLPRSRPPRRPSRRGRRRRRCASKPSSAAWPGLAGRTAARLAPAGTVRHAVLERRYSIEVFEVTEDSAVPRVSRRQATPGPRLRLLLPEELAREPRGGLMRKILALSAPGPDAADSSRRARSRRGPAPPKPPGG